MSWLEGRADRDHFMNPEAVERLALKRRRRRRKVRAVIAGGCLALIAAGILWGSLAGYQAGIGWLRDHTRLLQAREVNTSNTTWFGAWEIVEASGLVPGDDLLSAPLDTVAAKLALHPRIAAARVSRRMLTRSFQIDVEEIPPVAFALASGPVELGLGGEVLGRPESPSRPDVPRGTALPMIAGLSQEALAAGGRIEDPGIRRALAFLELMRHYRVEPASWISEVRPDNRGMLVVYLMEGGIPVKVGDGRISRRKVQALFAALVDLREKGIHPAAIDLRFEDQIVVKELKDEA